MTLGLYMNHPQVALAYDLARHFHDGQKYGDGPYINHPIRVAARIDDPLLQAAALLHDTLEDTEATDAGLIGSGVNPGVVEIVRILTRDEEGEDYKDYIERIIESGSQYAMKIKLSDLLDNLSQWPPERLRARYLNALVRISKALTL